MTTITKEWLQKVISGTETIRDDTPSGLDDDGSSTLAALKMALASMDAEPVYQCEFCHYDTDGLQWHWEDVNTDFFYEQWNPERCGKRRVLYTAPPAPVVSLTDEQLDALLDASGHVLCIQGDNRQRLRQFARDVLSLANMLQGRIPAAGEVSRG
ncbi:hypothetical protein B5864_16510 [Salmonella enterica]|uniref:Uncharacterized protein n=2 Tax=Salmonella enterica TaxID=28901 RepID=A0A403T779_SALER|nr:hypothetical protein [Salmonella sp. SG203]EAB7740807.1 hypothetical protein [Salmonella enterica subsp. enterica serovar Hadar]EAV6572637.1 hypothetical protein [Salmonella enterica]EBQ9005025.1 hypothetical protein [Salmonella enterica subsp. enterica serovar Blockley]EBR8260596.1 hypothetical protein [Salmonella enterica subsp. enterica serovar Cerro]EBW7256009.1 hypothetical protein [Salmonella enterica subsp. enterica serovar Gatow]EBX7467727.1 hypothetical protein [Salmonella enteric